jgi:phosphate:Na+ symporter
MGAVRGAVVEGAMDWFSLCMGLFGGLALFLGGLDLLSEGIKKVAGGFLRTALGKLTGNRFLGALTGAAVTGILNSSSVTTVLVVGFVTAGAMTLAQSVSVIMGANIGSTVTAQLLAFNISAYALLPVAAGFFLYFLGRQERVRYTGLVILGLGLVFYGMGVMGDSMMPLRDYEPFLRMLQNMEHPLIGVLVSALFTALVQSSAATVGIAIAMASGGVLTLESGITIALGANIGTCVTALLAGIGKPAEARRTAVVHLTFNVLGVAIWLPLISVLAKLAVAFSPESASLQGAARAAADVPRQIANANTIFNVINTLLFIGFPGLFAKVARGVVPDREAAPGATIVPEFLDVAALAVPSLALDRVRQELGRAGDIAAGMLEDIGPAVKDRDLAAVDAIVRRNAKVDTLEAAMLAYLARIRQGLLSSQESLELQGLMTAILDVESIADIVETDLSALARRISAYREPPGEVLTLLLGVYDTVSRAVRLAVQAVRDRDADAARAVLALKDEVGARSGELHLRESERLAAPDASVIDAVRLQMSLLEVLRHAYTLAKRMAKTVLPSPA